MFKTWRSQIIDNSFHEFLGFVIGTKIRTLDRRLERHLCFQLNAKFCRSCCCSRLLLLLLSRKCRRFGRSRCNVVCRRRRHDGDVRRHFVDNVAVVLVSVVFFDVVVVGFTFRSLRFRGTFWSGWRFDD